MDNENGQAVREAVTEYVRSNTGDKEAVPLDDEPITKHVGDFYDACDLSMLLVNRFPGSEEQISGAMRMMGFNEAGSRYNPDKGTLKTYEDLYAALDGVK